MRPQLMERSDISCLAEFDPPPLFVSVGQDKREGELGIRFRNFRSSTVSKSGGGLNSQASANDTMTDYNLRRYRFRKLSAHLRKEN